MFTVTLTIIICLCNTFNKALGKQKLFVCFASSSANDFIDEFMLNTAVVLYLLSLSYDFKQTCTLRCSILFQFNSDLKLYFKKCPCGKKKGISCHAGSYRVYFDGRFVTPTAAPVATRGWFACLASSFFGRRRRTRRRTFAALWTSSDRHLTVPVFQLFTYQFFHVVPARVFITSVVLQTSITASAVLQASEVLHGIPSITGTKLLTILKVFNTNRNNKTLSLLQSTHGK